MNTEKNLYEVRVTRLVKSYAERLLADAEKLTGDHYDMMKLDDIYEAMKEIGAVGTRDARYFADIVRHEKYIVRAWSASDAQEFMAELHEKDNFSVVLDIEVHEAIIWEAED